VADIHGGKMQITIQTVLTLTLKETMIFTYYSVLYDQFYSVSPGDVFWHEFFIFAKRVEPDQTSPCEQSDQDVLFLLMNDQSLKEQLFSLVKIKIFWISTSARDFFNVFPALKELNKNANIISLCQALHYADMILDNLCLLLQFHFTLNDKTIIAKQFQDVGYNLSLLIASTNSFNLEVTLRNFVSCQDTCCLIFTKKSQNKRNTSRVSGSIQFE